MVLGNMKLNQFQLLDGYFYFGNYIEWDEDNEVYKDPIKIRFKPNDAGTQGVSSGSKSQHMVQDSQGRPITKSVYTIKVYDNLGFKPKDNFKDLNNDRTYTIKDVYEDAQTVNSLANLQFSKMRDNKIYVLVMGEK